MTIAALNPEPAPLVGTPANDNTPRPSLGHAVRNHERLREAEAEAALKRKHLARKAVGFSGIVPANDNQEWPLLQALRREKNDALIPVAERYCRLWDMAHVNPLVGTDLEADIFNVVQRSADKADPDGRTKGPLVVAHTGGQNCGGRVIRETSAVADKRRRDGKPNPTRPGIARSRQWHGEDMVVSVIDAKRDILRLQAALGPLVAPFEEAVVERITLTEIGKKRGAGQSSSGAGKLLVMMGLEAVQTELCLMDRERAA